jgi:hypothetical protein
MFPETDELSKIISDIIKIVFKRRLVDRSAATSTRNDLAHLAETATTVAHCPTLPGCAGSRVHHAAPAGEPALTGADYRVRS